MNTSFFTEKFRPEGGIYKVWRIRGVIQGRFWCNNPASGREGGEST